MFVQPRRFLLLLMAGNVFAMAAFAFLRGPQSHLQHMFSPEVGVSFWMGWLVLVWSVESPSS